MPRTIHSFHRRRAQGILGARQVAVRTGSPVPAVEPVPEPLPEVKMSAPAAKEIARRGLDPLGIKATGRSGEIVLGDVWRHVSPKRKDSP